MDLEMPPMAPSAPDTLTPSALIEETLVPTEVIIEPSAPTEAEVLKATASDQDTNQRVGVIITVSAEIYRALIASFLILFVPQSCGDHVCSFSENAQTGTDPLYNAGFYMNIITFAAFMGLYVTELRRESKLISYLDVNPQKPCDNLSVSAVLEGLPAYQRDAIHYYDSVYIRAGYTTIVCFAINTVLSGLVVYKYYLDDKTTTTFITSVLFVLLKLQQVYATVNTEKNVYYSAYITNKIQYNDLDANKTNKEIKDSVPTVNL
jgi:hypothetical protein